MGLCKGELRLPLITAGENTQAMMLDALKGLNLL